jgi:hypothetical protein
MPRTSVRRRLLMPMVILLVGGSLAVWASQQQSQRSRAIQQLIMGICETATRGGDVRMLLPTDSPVLDGPLAAALTDVCGGADIASIDVTVRTGDMDGSHGATHLAVISVLDVPRLAVRLRDDDDGAAIIGFAWLGAS